MSITRTTSAPDPRAGDALVGADGGAVHLVTFGCQMNKYDSLMVEGRFRQDGFRITESMDDADVILFNTCSVRDHAEERTLSWLGELKRAKETRPDLVIGVMGCMAQRREDDIFRRAGHVDIVCGTRRFPHLPAMVHEVREQRAASAAGRVIDVEETHDWALERHAELYTGGLVGHLAVMRGCDLNCTYCIVPTTRGRVQSRPIADLVEEARWMVDGGARVITLLGQTVNSYGEDLPAPGAGEPRYSGRKGRPALADLLRAMQELDGLERIRLITLHPSYVTPALAAAIADCDKVDRFLPLPVQSGSDAVLKRMKRGYTTDLFRRRVDILRDAVPDIELGSDWIVGFPGETDADFEDSLALLGEVGFSQNYVFKYDPRPGTVADAGEDDVPTAVKKERNQRLLAAAGDASLRRHEAKLGAEVRTFVEKPSDRDPELLVGRTLHNMPVAFAVPAAEQAALVGTSVTVRVQQASPFNLAGERVEG